MYKNVPALEGILSVGSGGLVKHRRRSCFNLYSQNKKVLLVLIIMTRGGYVLIIIRVANKVRLCCQETERLRECVCDERDKAAVKQARERR